MRPIPAPRRSAAVALGGAVLALGACTPAPSAPPTVLVTSLSASSPSIALGPLLRASAGLPASAAPTLPSSLVAVRDAQGRLADFPLVTNKTIGTAGTQLTSSRSFTAPGVYTYWVAFNRNGAWTNLAPKKTFTVAASTPAPTPTPSPSTQSPSPSPT